MKERVITAIIISIFMGCKSNTGAVVGSSRITDLSSELHGKTFAALRGLQIADTSNNITSYIPLSVAEFVLCNFKEVDSLRIIFPLDGSCSFCIAEFIDLIQNKNIIEMAIPIHALLTSNDSSTVVYYLDKFNCKNDLVYIHNSVISDDEYNLLERMPIITYGNRVILTLSDNTD